jgi:hypothetical protein
LTTVQDSGDVVLLKPGETPDTVTLPASRRQARPPKKVT